ncbi:MAG: M20/M25/M40 family metallo-hydrolase [Bacteroidales bacterium]|nr:M20/M25/M40 family metallo-hydrolase [Bacteroidales bacterium]
MKTLFSLLILNFFVFGTANRTSEDITHRVSRISSDSIEAYVHTLTDFHTRHNLSTQTDPQTGIGAAARWLYRKVSEWIPASDGRLSVENVVYTAGGPGTRLSRQVELTNVMAVLKGTGTQEIWLLAHYDSRVNDNNDSTSFAPGSNDNGSGVACLLESLRVMVDIPMHTTVRFLFLSGEEHGLLGAAAMADIAEKEGWNVTAVINYDMIGNTESCGTGHRDNSGNRVFSPDGLPRELARYMKEIGELYVENLEVHLIFRTDRYGRGGDHLPFLTKGYTAVRVSEYHENYNRTHQLVREEYGISYGDLPSGVDFEYVRKTTAMNVAVVMSLANAPAAPKRVQMNTRSLSNYTELQWDIPPETIPVAGYYVHLRKTDQPLWQKKIFVTDNAITLPYSKDNYFFGVSTVGHKGHTSLVCPVD